MNLERAAMKGELADLERERVKLRLRAEGLCSSLRRELNTALTDVEEIDVTMISQQFDDLVGAYTDLAVVNGRVARLKKELG